MRPAVIVIVLSALAGVIVPIVNAQDHVLPIEGVVVDETGAMMPHAKLVFEAESGTVVAYTDISGVVDVMLAPGKYDVAISQVGFATTRLPVFLVPNADPLWVVLKVAPTSAGPLSIVPTVMGVQTVTSELPNVIADEHSEENGKLRDCQTLKHARHKVSCLCGRVSVCAGDICGGPLVYGLDDDLDVLLRDKHDRALQSKSLSYELRKFCFDAQPDGDYQIVFVLRKKGVAEPAVVFPTDFKKTRKKPCDSTYMVEPVCPK